MIEGSASLKCQTETSWFYSLFDQRQQLDHQQRRPQLTQYSRFKSNQLASMRIASLEISWDDKLGREVVSIDIRPPIASNKTTTTTTTRQRIYTNETLVVSELSCRSSSALDSVAWTGKIHLLALMNREVSRLATKSTSGKAPNATSKRDIIRTAPSASAADDDRPQADESQNSIDVERRSSEGLVGSSSSFHQSASNQSSSFMVDGGGGGATNQLASGNKWTDLNQKQQLPHATDGGLGESIRMRLKSSGFLLFTVSSSFVILAYTLCLLIYLKSRKKPIGGASSRRSRRPPAQRPSERAPDEQPAPPMCISEPFNLQMPEPTRTRLEMMLRANKRNGAPADVAPNKADQLLLLDTEAAAGDRQRERRAKKRHRRAAASVMMACPAAGFSCGQSAAVAPTQATVGSSFVGKQQLMEPVYHLAGGGAANCPLDSDLGYGTLQVVRAIRQAAAVARFRLRSSRYEPNLNVIHESDLEHLQQLAAAANNQMEEKRCRFAAATAADDADQNDQFFGRPEDTTCQLDHLVRDALNLECSHFIERIQQPSATLLSRPIDMNSNCSPSSGEQVSRSGIIKLVKQNSSQIVDKK